MRKRFPPAWQRGKHFRSRALNVLDFEEAATHTWEVLINLGRQSGAGVSKSLFPIPMTQRRHSLEYPTRAIHVFHRSWTLRARRHAVELVPSVLQPVS